MALMLLLHEVQTRRSCQQVPQSGADAGECSGPAGSARRGGAGAGGSGDLSRAVLARRQSSRQTHLRRQLHTANLEARVSRLHDQIAHLQPQLAGVTAGHAGGEAGRDSDVAWEFSDHGCCVV